MAVGMKIMKQICCVLVFTGLLGLSCSHLDDPGPACGGLVEYHAGDTLVVCFSASAVEFVGSIASGAYIPNNYNVESYLLREFQLATDAEQTIASSPYNRAFFFWKQETWDIRRSFLPFPFSQNILVPDSALFLPARGFP
jgi:hypothetical protein